MRKPDLTIVFGKKAPHEPGEKDAGGKGDEMEGSASESEESESTPEDDAEMDEALDAAIDDVFSTKDPEARREAFKTAVNLCKESAY